jgi:hypothetical protein
VRACGWGRSNPDALKEAILTLYHDPDRREHLGRNGRAHVEARYTPQVVARQYASLLERTAEGGAEGQGREAMGDESIGWHLHTTPLRFTQHPSRSASIFFILS